METEETLEEAAENNYCFESDIEMVNFISEMASTGKIPNRWSAFVAKINELYLFKQEQDKKMYSEEDMKSSFQVGFNVGYNDEESPSYLTFEEWIKRNKLKNKLNQNQIKKNTTFVMILNMFWLTLVKWRLFQL